MAWRVSPKGALGRNRAPIPICSASLLLDMPHHARYNSLTGEAGWLGRNKGLAKKWPPIFGKARRPARRCALPGNLRALEKLVEKESAEIKSAVVGMKS